MSLRRRVLVTRPEPGCTATCRALAAAGWDPVAAPTLAIEPGAPIPPPGTPPQAVLVTSANALPALAALPGTALFAVGEATEAQARALGWRRCRSAGGNAADLLALCRAELRPEGGVLLLLACAGEPPPLAAALREAGFAVSVAPAYAQRPARSFPLAAAEAIEAGSIGHALFFSPSAARAFVALLPRDLAAGLATAEALAISEAAAAPLRALSWNAVRVASRPNSADLLALL